MYQLMYTCLNPYLNCGFLAPTTRTDLGILTDCDRSRVNAYRLWPILRECLQFVTNLVWMFTICDHSRVNDYRLWPISCECLQFVTDLVWLFTVCDELFKGTTTWFRASWTTLLNTLRRSQRRAGKTWLPFIMTSFSPTFASIRHQWV